MYLFIYLFIYLNLYFHLLFIPRKTRKKSRQKMFDINYRPTTGRSSGFQGKKKHKGNLLQQVFSTYNSNRRSEECSSIGKKLVLCRNSSKLLEAWEILTKGPEISEIVKELKISFLKNPKQKRVPQTPHMGHEQAALIQVEIENMLKKGAIQQPEHQAGRFLSNIFLVGKKIGEIELW